MSDWRPTQELLNAYIDGELTADEKARVARAIADDPAVAEQIALLSRLKAALQESAREHDITLPAGRGAQSLPRVHRGALAAVVALALFLSGTIMLHLWQTPASPALLAEARRHHHAWQEHGGQRERAAPAGVVLAALSELGSSAMLPDLGSARLSLDYVRLHHAPSGTPLLHAGYRGTRGCHLSLFLTSALAGVPPGLTLYREDLGRAYAWRSGGLAFLLLAVGMDEARLDLIARSVHQATLEKAPLDPETRSALAKSRAASTPCLS